MSPTRLHGSVAAAKCNLQNRLPQGQTILITGLFLTRKASYPFRALGFGETIPMGFEIYQGRAGVFSQRFVALAACIMLLQNSTSRTWNMTDPLMKRLE